MPPATSLLLVWMFFKFCAEICVVSGCSFAVTCFTNDGGFSADVVSIGAQNMSFGMFLASNLAPWGTSERFRGTWQHKKRDLGVPGLDFCRFWMDFGTAIWNFLSTLEQKLCF